MRRKIKPQNLVYIYMHPIFTLQLDCDDMRV